MATNVHEPYVITTITSAGTLDTDPRRTSSARENYGRTSSSGMSAGSADTTDSGFYQLNPENLTPDLRSPSPRPSPRAIRRLSNMTESTDAEDIDFFLKVVTEFRAYVTEKIQELEEQTQINETQLEKLQCLLKESEEAWTANEINIKKEISSLMGLLQKQQSIYVEKIKKQRSKETDLLREKMDICRRNMKIISGVMGFARRIANEKDDSIRQHTLKDLKQRFTAASEREVPDITSHHEARVICNQTLDSVRALLEDSISGGSSNPQKASAIPVATCSQSNKPPTISAQSSPHDVTKSSIIVRWIDDDISDDVTYEVRWKSSNDLEPKWTTQVTDCQYVINGLNSNSDITVQVRKCTSNTTSELSAPGFFRTKPQPAKFHLDSDTANAKLQLSPDLYSVHYPGESKSCAPKSPARFTFALNVLGNISFFTGRHYWEVLVNTDGWAIGVAYRNVPRNSWLGSNDSSWILHYDASKKKYIARHAGEAVDVKVNRKRNADEIRRIGIFLDYEDGIISFVNCRHMEVLHTYRTNDFVEPVTAAVNPFYHGGALTVITGLDIPDINFGT